MAIQREFLSSWKCGIFLFSTKSNKQLNSFWILKKIFSQYCSLHSGFCGSKNWCARKKHEKWLFSRWLWWTTLCREEQQNQLSLRGRKFRRTGLPTIVWTNVCQSVCLQKLGQIQNVINFVQKSLKISYKTKKGTNWKKKLNK